MVADAGLEKSKKEREEPALFGSLIGVDRRSAVLKRFYEHDCHHAQCRG
jgi:hypothetical protein